MTTPIYIFSGLGADERVFQKLDFSGYNVTFIEWETPQQNETIENYATRLLPQIKTDKPILIGLSFAGIMAVEVAKQINTEKIILVASAKTKSEIPFYYRWAGKLGLHDLLPSKLLKQSNFITNWFFGTTSAFEQQLLKTILFDTNPVFLKWAINEMVGWRNLTKPENIVHIHGTADRILPFRFIDCNFEIKNGGHFMTLNKAEELMQIIKTALNT